MAKNKSKNRISNSRVFKTPVIKVLVYSWSQSWFWALVPNITVMLLWPGFSHIGGACCWSVPQSVLMGIDGVHEILWFGVKEGNKWLWFRPTNKTVHGLHGWNVSVSTGNGVSLSAFVECGYTLDFWLFSPSCSAFLWAPGSFYLLYWGEICVRIMSPTNT